jgi:hypothetical protein
VSLKLSGPRGKNKDFGQIDFRADHRDAEDTLPAIAIRWMPSRHPGAFTDRCVDARRCI